MKINFIGAGNMASALIKGLINDGQNPTDISVMDISADARGRAKKLGLFATDNVASLPTAAVYVLAVKPQQMESAIRPLGGKISNSLVLSVAAGVSIKVLRNWLGDRQEAIRAMPNTPSLIGSGFTGLYADSSLSIRSKDLSEKIMKTVGKVVWLPDERSLDAITAISGSGPAYVFYFIEAMEKAAIDLGLDRDIAREAVVTTFLGASELISMKNDTAGELRAKVTSKRGTTEEAIRVFNNNQTKNLINEAVIAAYERSLEITLELENDAEDSKNE